MKNKFGALSIAAIMSAVPLAVADVREDAAYIASIMQSDAVIDVQLMAIEGLLKDSLKVNLSSQGVEVSESGLRVVTEIFVEEFSAIFKSELRTIYADSLLKHLDESEIAGLKSFLESEAGAAFGEKQASMVADMARDGEKAGAIAGVEVSNKLKERLRGSDGQRFSDADLQALLNGL